MAHFTKYDVLGVPAHDRILCIFIILTMQTTNVENTDF